MVHKFEYSALNSEDSSDSLHVRWSTKDERGVRWLPGCMRPSKIFILLLSIVLISSTWSTAYLVITSKEKSDVQDVEQDQAVDVPVPVPVPVAQPAVYDSSRYLNGPAANSFRENLRSDVKYVTGWNFAGMTNDFMAYCNLIYLGMLSSRIPIVPPFVPELGHLAQGSLNTDFSEFFDLSRLRESLNYPVLEWSQVKKAAYAGSEFDLENVVEEPIGCWTNMKPFSDSHQVQQTNLPNFLKLDVSYTSTPRSAKLNEWNDAHTSFLGLSSIMYPTGRAKALNEKTSVPSYSPHQNLSLVPDDHLTCFDTLYFAAGRDTYEWEKDYSPVWTLVGKHMRFTKKVEDIAMFYLRKVFGVERNEDIPPFISVHVRRSDFSWKKCLELTKKEECFLPLSAYATQIGHVQAELRSLNSPYPDGTHILVTSDEKDPNWWAQVRERGWYFIDHGGEKTSEVHGKWYPSIIDAYVQSQGIAFVGTGQSTMSLVAARRVQYWNNGPSRMVELN